MKPFLIALAALPILTISAAADTFVGPDARLGLSVTAVQNGPALVRDRREAMLNAGAQVLIAAPAADHIDETGLAVGGNGLTVLSRQILPGGLDADSLLRAHLGREVVVVWRNGAGIDREERAKIVAPGPVPVFEIAGKAVVGKPERIIYDSLPPGMSATSSIRVELDSAKAGKQQFDLSYMTQGLSWRPVYDGRLDGDVLTLSAWAHLENGTGMDFPQTRWRLLAGEQNNPAPAPRGARMEKVMMSAAMDAAPVAQDFGPYHLYMIERPHSLAAGESKQIPLIAPAALKVERVLDLAAAPAHAFRARWNGAALNPDAVLVGRNSTGTPLPAGRIAVAARANDDALTPMGGDMLPALADGAPFRLALGKAFDVTAQRVQTDMLKVSADVIETAWEVRLRNGGAQPETVVVRERFNGEWLVLEESAAHVRDDSQSLHWKAAVPAKGETVLHYRVRLKQ